MVGFEGYYFVFDYSCVVLVYFVLNLSEGKLLDVYGVIYVLLFDFGGGILNVILVIVDMGIIEVIVIFGDSELGGQDFDQRLFNYFIEKIKLKYEKDVIRYFCVFMRLKKQVERVKLVFFFSMEVIFYIDFLFDGFDFEFSILCFCFEEMNMDFLEGVWIVQRGVYEM